jgi:hypothetical protein
MSVEAQQNHFRAQPCRGRAVVWRRRRARGRDAAAWRAAGSTSALRAQLCPPAPARLISLIIPDWLFDLFVYLLSIIFITYSSYIHCSAARQAVPRAAHRSSSSPPTTSTRGSRSPRRLPRARGRCPSICTHAFGKLAARLPAVCSVFKNATFHKMSVSNTLVEPRRSVSPRCPATRAP